VLELAGGLERTEKIAKALLHDDLRPSRGRNA